MELLNKGFSTVFVPLSTVRLTNVVRFEPVARTSCLRPLLRANEPVVLLCSSFLFLL